jgi:hypothetical protein
MTNNKEIHYSERLGRFFEDGDELTREEAAAVLSRNSGREIESKYVFDLVRLGVLHPRYLSPRKLLYQYSEVKSYVVASRVGKRPHAHPTENALRQRRFRERRRAQSLNP